jgi:esterase
MALDLACETLGSGPPLLILHGLFGSGSNWRRVGRQLAATQEVHLVDLRNHGKSPWSNSMGYVEMAEDVLRLMQLRMLQRASVLGHSMGGKVAMALALLHPGEIDRLIVVDVAPVAYADRLSVFAEAMRAIDMLHAASRDEVRQRLAETVADAGVVDFLMMNLVARNDRFDWRLNLAAIAAAIPTLSDFPSELRGLRYERPVHVIAGGRSDYVRRADGEEFRPMFGEPIVEVIEPAGHWVHAEQPEKFIAAVQRALRDNAPGAARPV